MGKTTIGWTDHTWPLVNGCRRISPGCGGASGVGGCYAERLISTRLRHQPKYQGLAVYKEGNGPQWTGKTRLWEPDLLMPLRLRKAQKIFVADMGDLFYEKVTDAEIDRVFGIMLACIVLETWQKRAIPGHIFQVLTKRADRMRAYLSVPPPTLLERWGRAVSGDVHMDGGNDYFWEAVRSQTAYAWGPDGTVPYGTAFEPWQHYQKLFPLPNVWLGVSVEDQRYANERIPELLQTPAHTRFVSYEPALGPVDFTQWMWPVHWCWDSKYPTPEESLAAGSFAERHRQALVSAHARFLDWVIVGGESGVGARPVDVDWLRSTVQQCKEAGTACFVKQLGRGANMHSELGRGYHHHDKRLDETIVVKDSKGEDWDQWPKDLQVRQFPNDVSRNT